MKHWYRFALLLLALGFVVTIAFLMALPDTVPTHYNFAGEVDRMGSKYEYIVFPCLAAAACAIFLPLAKRVHNKKEEDYVLVEKILVACAIGEILLFNGLGVYFVWQAASYTGGSAASAIPSVDVMRLLSFLIGILLIIFSIFMPKAKRNAFFGLRTKWSMFSDEIWQKSQRFASFASLVAGALLLATGVFLKGCANLLAQTAILTIWVVLCIMASYRYYKAANCQ